MRIDLHIPGSSSLKSKRQVLRNLKDRISNKFNVSISEVGHQDLWQRAELAVAAVSGESRRSDQVVSKVIAVIENHPQVTVLDIQTEKY